MVTPCDLIREITRSKYILIVPLISSLNTNFLLLDFIFCSKYTAISRVNTLLKYTIVQTCCSTRPTLFQLKVMSPLRLELCQGIQWLSQGKSTSVENDHFEFGRLANWQNASCMRSNSIVACNRRYELLFEKSSQTTDCYNRSAWWINRVFQKVTQARHLVDSKDKILAFLQVLKQKLVTLVSLRK